MGPGAVPAPRRVAGQRAAPDHPGRPGRRGELVAGYELRHRGHGSTSTTTLATTTTGSDDFDHLAGGLRRDVDRRDGQDRDVPVPSAHYQVAVTGAAGAEARGRLSDGVGEHPGVPGTVDQGHTESLEMTGVSRLTLGSPHNAAVPSGGSPVTLPTPLTSPLTLVFTPATG